MPPERESERMTRLRGGRMEFEMDRMRIEVELVGPHRAEEVRRVLRRNEMAATVPRQTRGLVVAAWLRWNLLGACRRWPVVGRDGLRPDECFRRPVSSLGQRPS